VTSSPSADRAADRGGDRADDRSRPAGSGTLFVVATPIGNLGDLTVRAAEVLGRVDVVACEDTRRTAKLLSHLGLPRPEMVVVNEHTEADAAPRVAGWLTGGRDVALVSDAGTPLVSDPGHRVIRAAIDAGVRVEPVPGASALLAALVASGLPADSFVFEGFLPRKGAGRRERLERLELEARTTILYESPHRVAATLSELSRALGPTRRVAVAREITKVHEEVWRGDLGSATVWIDDEVPRGEYVIVVGGAERSNEVDDGAILEQLGDAMRAGASRRDAVDRVAAATGVARNRVYELALTVANP
jgi:16S rRNA (cytidine1402-2'-O)-methyltransferase